MLNERELSKKELEKREEFIKDLKDNKRGFVKRYGKDAEKVMYAIATKRAKKQNEEMNKDKIREMIKSSLQGPVSEKKGKDMDGDGDIDSQDYLAARDAAIKKAKAEKQDLKEFGSSDISTMLNSMHRALGNPTEFPGLTKIMDAAGDAVDFYLDDVNDYFSDRDDLVMDAARQYARRQFPEFMAMASKMMEPIDEMNINDPVMMKMRAAKMKKANAGGDGNDKFFAKNTKRLSQLRALKDKRAQIMRDMEQEAEMEGGPIADRYGDMLNKIDKAIGMLQTPEEKEYALTREGFLSGRRYVTDGIETLTYNLGYSDVYKFFDDNPGALDAVQEWVESIPEFRDMLDDINLNEDLDLGHQDNEPHMLKADLYRIGKYAMELYQMVDQFEGKGEVDFPHWWQSKVTKAKDALVGAKHYLDFEIKEPQIDAMVDVAQEEDVIDENAFIAMMGANSVKDKDKPKEKDEKDYSNESLKEGTWSLGTSEQIKDAIQSLEMLQGMDAASIADSLEEDNKFYYNVIGDDLFHDAIDRAEREAGMGNIDRAQNGLADAIGRAEDLLQHVQKREGLNEEAPGKADMVASDIQKAMNAAKGDEAKTYQLKKARTAMNKGDLDKAKKIADRIAKQLKSK